MKDAQANVASGTQEFDKERKLFNSVSQHVRQKQFKRAQGQARKIKTLLLQEMALWLIYSSDSNIASFDDVKPFTDQPTNWPRQTKLRRNAEKALPASMSDAEVLNWFKDNEPTSYAGFNRYISALHSQGKSSDAEDFISSFWREAYLGKTDENKFIKKYGFVLSDEDHNYRLDTLIWNKHYVAANRQISHVKPGQRALARARMALLKGGGNVDGLIKKVPSELRQDPSLIYARARWRLRANKNDETIALLDPPLPHARQADKWWSIRHWAARKVLIKKDYEKAYRIASGHGLSQGVGFAEGEWLTGWIALRKLGMPRRAYTHFHQLYNGVKSPISKARAAYWAGRAAKEIGHSDWAQRWFTIASGHQTTFYGQQANYELGKEPSLELTANTPVGDDIVIEFENKKIVQSIKLLNKIGENKLVVTFLTRLRLDAQNDTDHILAAELAKEVSHPNIALRTAKSARQKGILLPDLLYPDIGLSASQISNTDPALVLALIRQESEFNHKAISHAGARGLMQLMPATAKSVAKKEKVKYKKTRLTDDPTYNIQLGSAYLSELLGSFNGSYVMALAGYNAGPHRVRKWVKDYGDPRDPNVDIIDWMEQIPFNETRNYVQRILESHIIYRAKIGAQPNETLTTGSLPFSIWGHQNIGG